VKNSTEIVALHQANSWEVKKAMKLTGTGIIALLTLVASFCVLLSAPVRAEEPVPAQRTMKENRAVRNHRATKENRTVRDHRKDAAAPSVNRAKVNEKAPKKEALEKSGKAHNAEIEQLKEEAAELEEQLEELEGGNGN
jgi:hypothetical protein